MRGPAALIDTLNALLSDELAAISQYIVQAETCGNWGYGRLQGALFGTAKQEMKHAERLIERIVFLEGHPDVTKLGPISIGKTVPEMLASNLVAENRADDGYNEGIKKAVLLHDNVTRDLFESILQEEEQHIDWVEAQQTQIEQMGLGNYLASMK
jgi:bacterioferritin